MTDHTAATSETARCAGDWSVWPLAADKVRPESFGWEVTIDVRPVHYLAAGTPHYLAGTPMNVGVGGFTDTNEQATQAVRRALAQYRLGMGREVQP